MLHQIELRMEELTQELESLNPEKVFHIIFSYTYIYYVYPTRCPKKRLLVKWIVSQEGYIEELSTCFNLNTALLKSSESVLSET